MGKSSISYSLDISEITLDISEELDASNRAKLATLPRQQRRDLERQGKKRGVKWLYRQLVSISLPV